MKTVSDILAERRRHAVEVRDARVEQLYHDHPNLALLHHQRLQMGRELLSQIITSTAEEQIAVRREMQDLQKQETAGWHALGVPDEAFTPDYFCEDCHDQGFVNGVSCHCRNDLLAEARYQMSDVRERIEKENFSHFDLSLFRRDRQPGENQSPFENMKWLKQFLLRRYIPAFPKQQQNLYFYGPPGTGKTFLLNSIVKAVLDRGMRVYYQTAPALLEFLASYSFTFFSDRRQEDRDRHDFVFSADLLVIDDLGSEYTTEKIVSVLFEVLNSRILSGLPTIVSSNLRLDEMEEAYDARIASRISGEYLIFELFGSDLRRRI